MAVTEVEKQLTKDWVKYKDSKQEPWPKVKRLKNIRL